jgi:hypothetical protein
VQEIHSLLGLEVVLLLGLGRVRSVRVLARDDLHLRAGNEVVIDLELGIPEVEGPDLVTRVVRVEVGLRGRGRMAASR